ncbi:MAG TPA: hypothetical protein VMI54_00090 [Polyangiaceae bacterium]|nr:hypothetical protein [Polyangiaceae bacterium]
MLRRSALLLVLGLSLTGAACSREYLPNTDVEDTDFNRRVIEFCEDYRHAVERKNVGLLLKLADERYYEDGATIDTSDDLDLAGLREYLETKFKDVKSIRYEIRYRNVSLGRNNEIYVDYTYSASYLIPTSKGDVWRRTVADNRLALVPTGETFKILSGM